MFLPRNIKVWKAFTFSELTAMRAGSEVKGRRLRMERSEIREAFTFVELLIVIAIISIISAGLLPSFGGFSRRQSFRDSAAEFADNVRLVRTKSHSGVVISGSPVQRVSWGIDPSCGNSTYVLGYKDGGGTWVSSGANTRSMTLSEGSTFDSTICGGPIIFTRLKGTPDNQYTVKINGMGGSVTVAISSQGRVSIN